MNDELSYEYIIENGLWLEDRGVYSRYMIDNGSEGDAESIWVNNETEEVADPDSEEREEEA